MLSIYLILPAALGPGVYSASNRNEYQKHTNNISGGKAPCLCGLVVRVLGYRSGGPGSIPGTTRKKK
jgi:hypothetical protein